MTSKRRYWLTGRHPLPFGVFFIVVGILEMTFTDSKILSLFVVAVGVFFLVVGLRWRKEEQRKRLRQTPPAE